jgi:hypothetical protein
VEASGLFERYFAAWQTGIRIDNQVYPFAQRVGPFWLVGVNSCTGNRWPWDAGGSVRPDQLKRLEQLLARLEPGPRILVTHYPVWLASGKLERRTHGLRNLTDLISVAVQGGICLWLHGHRHTPYHHVRTDLTPFPVVCTGSATQFGLWAYGDYTLDGNRFHAVQRVFEPTENVYRDRDAFELQLRG